MSEKKSKHSSIGLAESALDALLQAVSKNRTDDAANFVSMLEDMKKKWKDAGPSKTGCVNMVDRAIKFIHEAYEECEGDPDIKPIAGSELSARSSDGHLPDIYNVRSFRNRYKELRREVLSKLADLKEELGTVIPMICQQSIEHIHVNEIVMTSGYSTTILEFCKKVRASGRQFHIIVAESEPVTAVRAMVRDAHMINPLYDYIPPSLVNIIITNTDSYAPQNIYRAVADLYVSVTS
ncbi:hypothetical protein PTSG_12388 [Salpingoeca rosetta]|uniref:Translation initiation factor eIF2B subunit beta n=1 Tax=Salpingoeca rosetta (strain ATCC 50818 / BSB-021) TaxID=946362 RepID=F2UDJ4_SALR5|nr:uncharacterized protein PTSG_12388 [Salpingoeca rosetta]EGD74689.1 hypothetical protein PTSG_12388 [Salpingoeca rosetta]|eukprot:XP_004992946.1 hypothetical protein PTSG_12388 [Salpingoeca rosetta]